MRNLPDRLLTLTVAGLAVLALIGAWEWPAEARLFPTVIAVTLVALACVKGAVEVLRGPPSAPEETEGDAAGAELPRSTMLLRALVALAWISAFGLVMWAAGFVWGATGMTLVFLVWGARERWLVSVPVTALLGLSLLAMRELLNLPLPGGWLW